MEALGRLFDISTGISPVDLSAAANTGKRVSLRNASGVAIVVFKAAGTAGQDPVLTLKEHNASSGGTSQNLAVIDSYYVKSETTLDGDETWTRKTQAAAATLSDPGGAGTSAEEEQIVVIEVDATQLSDGFGYVSLDIADVGANAQVGGVLYILRDLTTQRTPANLAAPLS